MPSTADRAAPVTKTLDSQAVARQYLSWIKEELPRFSFTPALATIMHRPTADAASLRYRDLIISDASGLGLKTLALEAKEAGDLLEMIRKANEDPGVHGIMVFYPLRCALDDTDVMDRVSPFKDAEGLHSTNLGYLVKYKKFLDESRGIKCVVPATAKAVVKALQAYPEVPIRNSFVAIVNNSMRVGKPLSLMLENLGATVVACYHLTKPKDLEQCVRQADILITAVPDPAFRIDPGWVKPGAAVLDVSHPGNIDVGALQGKASLATAPDNRIGRVTRAMILVNLLYCAKYKGIYY